MTEPNRLYIVTHRDGTHERLIAAQDANHVRQFVTIVRKAKAEDVARILMGGGTIEHADTTANPHPDQGELPLVDPADAAPGREVYAPPSSPVRIFPGGQPGGETVAAFIGPDDVLA